MLGTFGSAKDLVFRIHMVLCPNNEILRRCAPQNDVKYERFLLCSLSHVDRIRTVSYVRSEHGDGEPRTTSI